MLSASLLSTVLNKSKLIGALHACLLSTALIKSTLRNAERALHATPTSTALNKSMLSAQSFKTALSKSMPM